MIARSRGDGMSARIITELDAKEAAMNGAIVRYRRCPPYLPCVVCGGDGTHRRPYMLGCFAPHDPGWELVEVGRGTTRDEETG